MSSGVAPANLRNRYLLSGRASLPNRMLLNFKTSSIAAHEKQCFMEMSIRRTRASPTDIELLFPRRVVNSKRKGELFPSDGGGDSAAEGGTSSSVAGTGPLLRFSSSSSRLLSDTRLSAAARGSSNSSSLLSPTTLLSGATGLPSSSSSL